MGLFTFLFGERPKEPAPRYEETFKMLSGYSPRFTSFDGGLYESERVRSAIHARATHMSKLSVEFRGAAHPSLIAKLRHGPNSLQTWGQFLARLSTCLDIHNNAFIVPTYDDFGEIDGIFCPAPMRCEIVAFRGIPYIRYEFGYGEHAALELSKCGLMVTHQYRSDFFGEPNDALFPTMELINITNQGIEEGVKSAATYRFMAQLSNFSRPEDLAKEQKRWTAKNLLKGGGGLLLFPNTYKDIKQVDVKPWVVDAEQMKVINENVNNYFGVNDDILTNKAYGDSWNAFYEGAIEPFAVQLSDVLSKMLYTLRERSQGNGVTVTSNRLQYMSNADKLAVSSQLLDRGIMSINDVRQIWNLPPVDGGDERIIRGEYYNAAEKVNNNEQNDSGET